MATRNELIEERARLLCLVEALDEEIWKLEPMVCDRPRTEMQELLAQAAESLSKALARRFAKEILEPNPIVELLEKNASRKARAVD